MAKPSQDNFYKRLNQLAGTNKSKVNEQSNGNGTLIDFQKSDDGAIYGIVKENHRYFIKKSTSQKEKLDESDFAYIGGLENIHNYEYHSLSEAEKQRNLYIKNLNEAISLSPKKKSVNESTEEEKIENPFSFIRNKINEGKTTLKSEYENKFKSSMKDNIEETNKKRGLMPEAADIAVKKALGLIKEEDMVTADSEIKDKDKVSEKSGKEKPQAPINDENAKTEAEKAMGKDKMEGKKKDSKSIAVNEEASPLVTDDSELDAGSSLANDVNHKHEAPQAPINDGNAKAMADKAMGKSASADSAMPNDTEESEKSEPFDDKEDKGDEKGDIVTEGDEKSDPFEEDVKKEKDISTEDSDQDTEDSVADKETVTTKPEAAYNNYNQPDKGQKEEKGEELKPIKEKGAIVTEGKKEDMDGDGDIDSDDYMAKKDAAIKKAKKYPDGPLADNTFPRPKSANNPAMAPTIPPIPVTDAVAFLGNTSETNVNKLADQA